jgi:hypothetical protein
MRLRCQQTYPNLRRCHNRTFRESQWCYAHRILQKARKAAVALAHADERACVGFSQWPLS